MECWPLKWIKNSFAVGRNSAGEEGFCLPRPVGNKVSRGSSLTKINKVTWLHSRISKLLEAMRPRKWASYRNQLSKHLHFYHQNATSAHTDTGKFQNIAHGMPNGAWIGAATLQKLRLRAYIWLVTFRSKQMLDIILLYQVCCAYREYYYEYG